MSNQKKVIVKSAGLPALPDWLTVVDGSTGTEGMDSNDVSMPLMKIAQAQSGIISDEDSGAKPGVLYDKMTKEIYGESVNVFPLLFWKSKVWFSSEFSLLRSECKSITTGEPLSIGLPVDDPQLNEIEALDSYNFFLMLESELTKALKSGTFPMPTRWMTVKAANAPTKQLNSKLKINAMRKIPIYGQLVTISTKLQKFKTGQAYMPVYTYGRWASKEEAVILNSLYKKAIEMQSGIVVNQENLNGTEVHDSGDTDDIPF